MPRRAAALLAMSVVALLAAGALAAPPSPAVIVLQVTINDAGFSSSSIAISTGLSVRWTNVGTLDHTTTSDTAVWDSGSLSAGTSFTYTFNEAGTFPYHCTIHPAMMG